LAEFKAQAEKKDKEAMIASFYMLSDEDKKDVIDNIDTYSLNDIEAQLSILCVRNKVNFSSLEDDKENQGATTYNLEGSADDDDAATPAWVKAALRVSKSMN
jgi:6-pyruvoyl-tetrahydropterin synthase